MSAFGAIRAAPSTPNRKAVGNFAGVSGGLPSWVVKQLKRNNEYGLQGEIQISEATTSETAALHTFRNRLKPLRNPDIDVDDRRR